LPVFARFTRFQIQHRKKVLICCNLRWRIPQEAGSMKTEKIANRCPKCQALLPADSPQGLCAKCLLLAAATPTEAGQPPGEHSTPPPLDAVTTAFPQLEIIELIGHGGMGVVYKARQPRLDRFVALKLLPQSLAADAAFAERFNREARVLARLNHPNIVTVHDFGQSGGYFYLLMEFVDGVNLRQAMRAGRFSPHQALFLVPKICEALQFAHDEGVLHRDIKPENILLDTRGRVKIADFGIAKLVGEARESLTLTASGMVVGTPHYMAPEQLEHPQDVDQRADIYSLGVVFYEMLTGELPIGRFAPPSEKSSVDPRVDEVVLHALEKEREKRYHSAGEVKTSVEAITAVPPAARAEPAPVPAAVLPERQATCYFSTPERMRKCFPGPWAQVFQCKGDLRLESANLTFVSPWQTRVVMPLKEIRDLSIGQFRMWKGPWVFSRFPILLGPGAMNYEPLSFLSVTFGAGDRQRTVHLTPVPTSSPPVSLINAQVSGWFDAIRNAVRAATGAAPHVSERGPVSIGSQRAWNPKALLVFAPLIAWLVAIVNIWPAEGPASAPAWAGALALTLLLCLALAWFFQGFFKTHQALKSGNLDAVTGNEDPKAGPGPSVVPRAEPAANKPTRPFWWTLSAWAFVVFGLLAVIDTLAGLYSRPVNPTLSPGVVYLFAGIAVLTLSRRWRLVALLTLALALVAGALIGIMTAVSPEHGVIKIPVFNLSIPVTEEPRWAAVGVVLMAIAFGWPGYLLLSAKAKALFGLARPK
jgi:serine/threonine protein kinase